MAACLLAPATAAAGTYRWALASDFTTTGANPDKDAYGAHPWSYWESAPPGVLGASHNPSTFTRLGSFQSDVRGGLDGWSDSPSGTIFLGINPFVDEVSDNGVDYPGETIAAQPGSDRFVAVAWTSPLPRAAAVNVTGSIAGESTDPLCALGTVTWSVDQNGSAIQSGSSTPGTINAKPTVPAGGTIYITVSPPVNTVDQSCTNVSLGALQMQATDNTPPAVSITSPGQGAVTAAQPTISGSASAGFGASSQVTVRIYSGSTAGGAPVQTLTTSRSGTGYAVHPSPLPDGQYTAQAAQSDLSVPADTGLSAPVTFIVHTAPPTITLDSPGTKPLHTATPTLTGVAGTGPGDGTTVHLGIYSGRDTGSALVRAIAGRVGADGHFSIQVTPALADGQYTAVVAQQAAGGIGLSPTRTFRVKVHGPAVTLAAPPAGGSVAQADVVFAGQGGTALGDYPQVSVWLYRGEHARGRPLGIVHAAIRGASWAVRWSRQLKLGLYTVKAVQGDDAGHTVTTPAHTFLVVPGPSVIGRAVTLNRSGGTSLSITCVAPAAQVCTGSVLALTVRKLQPTRSAPPGRLRVMFGFVTITGGKTVVVRDSVSGAAARALRRAKSVKVAVTAKLSIAGSSPTTFSAVRPLRVQ